VSEQSNRPANNRGPGGNRGPRGPRRGRPSDQPTEGTTIDGKPVAEVVEKVIFINRSSKVVKGGRRFSFSALIVTGDKRGKVGLGLGKAGEVADAIRKGGEVSRSRMMGISMKGTTIPHEVFSAFGGAKVLLRPASPGTGIIAGKTVRAVLESVGIKDILSKSLGSSNAANVAKATLAALQQLRVREEIYKARGRAVKAVQPAV
jgi:small subunit ribosomal protein S5